MFNFFFKPKKGTGAVLDPRTDEEKLKDFRFEELGLATASVWTEKPQSEWRKFPVRDQDGSLSCVMHSIAKVLGVENYLEEGRFVELSAYDGYERRSNKPGGGMIGVDALTIGKEFGLTLEQFLPSQGISEEAMNKPVDRKPSMELVAKVFKGGNFVMLPADIDAIASVIDRGKAVMVWFLWDLDEWDRPAPQINPQSQRKNHHSVTAVDRTLWQGKKAIVIDDSWGKNFGLNGQRVLTEDWIRERMTFAAYYENFANSEVFNNQPVPKPSFTGTRVLKPGDRGDDVAQLQRCLGYLKDADGPLFPIAQSPTGFYGGITRNGVKRFQVSAGIPVSGLVDSETLQRFREAFP